MGALGNSRRGGRSPSLLVAALIVCILLLGFNYWVSNSRNIELQSKILELKDRMRQLAGERDREGQSRIKVEEDMRAQSKRLEIIEDAHRRQQDSALNNWKQEKETLKLNISSSAKTVQEMKNRMKSLLENLSKMQTELKSCQSNMDTFTTQCKKEIAAMTEKCSERTAAAELDKQKSEKEPKRVFPLKVAQNLSTAKSELPAINLSDKNAAEPLNSKSEVDPQSKNDVQVQNNTNVTEKAAVILKQVAIPTSKPTIKNETENRLANEQVPEAVMNIKEESIKTTDSLLDEAGILEPKEDLGIGDMNEEKARIGERQEDAIMYDNDGEIEKQLSKIKDENQGAGQDQEDEMANYNGDDDNQPESEDEKQAELTQM